MQLCSFNSSNWLACLYISWSHYVHIPLVCLIRACSQRGSISTYNQALTELQTVTIRQDQQVSSTCCRSPTQGHAHSQGHISDAPAQTQTNKHTHRTVAHTPTHMLFQKHIHTPMHKHTQLRLCLIQSSAMASSINKASYWLVIGAALLC